MRMIERAAFALLLALALPHAIHGARVVAIGDIHGAYEPLVAILRSAGLVDEQTSWSGGDATLVQLGDFTDRGPRVRAVMDLLMRLQEEAPAGGGRVIVLLGNHEALNLVGELRDASAPAFFDFASEVDEAAREEEYRAMVRATRARARLTGAPRPVFDEAARETWMRTHPAGRLAYLRALEPDGRYGRWLRGLPTVTVIGEVVFLHGGIDPELSGKAPDQINGRVRDEIAWLDACRSALRGRGYLSASSTTGDLLRVGFAMLDQLTADRDKGSFDPADTELLSTLEHCVDYENWHLFSPTGPLWFRGYADPRPSRTDREGYGWTEEEGLPRIARVLAELGARHLVVGHSTRNDSTIAVRFGGRAFLIDTGMLAEVYGGRPAALEIDRGTFTAIYTDRREELWDTERTTELAPEGAPAAESARPAAERAAAWRWIGPDGQPLPFRGPEDLEDFLRTAEVISAQTIDQGVNRPRKVLLERDGVRAHAVFRTVAVEARSQQGPEGKFYRMFRDSYQFECAAYELAGVLGLDHVPPAVPRSMFGQSGSLQAWVENAITEAKRLEEGTKPPDVLRWSRAQTQEHVFDALINNIDRNEGNELIDADWNVWWIDHTRAFQTEYGDERVEALQRITP